MKVLAHNPSGWFLVQDGRRLLFDVNCSHSAFGFSRVFELSEGERTDYGKRGSAFLDDLAEKVQYHAMDLFAIRHLGADIERAVTEAVSAWRASGGEVNG